MPSTSQITAFTFQEVFQKFYEQGYTDLIYVSINAGGSATNQNAKQARDMLYEEIPESKSMNIHIIDGENYTMCYGYPVLKAAEMAESGASKIHQVAVLESEGAEESVVSVISEPFPPLTLNVSEIFCVFPAANLTDVPCPEISSEEKLFPPEISTEELPPEKTALEKVFSPLTETVVPENVICPLVAVNPPDALPFSQFSVTVNEEAVEREAPSAISIFENCAEPEVPAESV